jgi:hypothetical protein
MPDMTYTSHMKPPVALDTNAIFAAVGGTAGQLALAIEKYHGVRPPQELVAMWKTRKAIPSTWTAAVLDTLQRIKLEQGEPFELNEFVVDRDFL